MKSFSEQESDSHLGLGSGGFSDSDHMIQPSVWIQLVD